MKLIQELHELSEAKSKRKAGKKSTRTKTLKLWDKLENHGVVADIKVTYTLSDNGINHHPYGEGSAAEDMGYEVEIDSAVLAKETDIYDEDGHEVIKTLPAGTSVEELPGWKNSLWKAIEKAIDDLDAKAK